jgi:hypothetical protein
MTDPAPPWNAVTPLLKGALVQISPTTFLPTYLVMFQYNPQELSRSLTPRYYKNRGDRFTGPPKETVDVTVQLEASQDGGTSITGLLGRLAALQMLITPSSIDLIPYTLQVSSDAMQAVPPLAPRTLFVWGPSRVLPVRLTSMRVTEELFNNLLSPMIAKVQLQMEIRPLDEALPAEQALILANVAVMEAMGLASVASGLLGLAGVNVPTL